MTDKPDDGSAEMHDEPPKMPFSTADAEDPRIRFEDGKRLGDAQVVLKQLIARPERIQLPYFHAESGARMTA
jgi:hypothetical protein